MVTEAHQDELRECPFCAELIKRQAKLCKHCQSSIEPEAAVNASLPLQAGTIEVALPTCWRCTEQFQPGTRFCTGCGATVDAVPDQVSAVQLATRPKPGGSSSRAANNHEQSAAPNLGGTQPSLCKSCKKSSATAEPGDKGKFCEPCWTHTKNAGRGCLTFFICIVVLVWIAGLMNHFGPPVSISGNTGTVEVPVYSWHDASAAGSDVADAVYNTASNHRELRQLIVNCKMSSAGVTDKYGIRWKEDHSMGTITVDDLDGVRKYNDKYSYEGSIAGRLYSMQLRNMQYGYLLKQ